MADQSQINRLSRALRGQHAGAAGAVRVVSQRTTRDNHPTLGSHAIVQLATAGAKRPRTTSLNVTRGAGSPAGGPGTRGRAFAFNVPGFGWGQGEFT